MSVLPALRHATTGPTPPSAPSARSRVRWLPLAHVGVILATILGLVFFVVSLPAYFTFVTAPCLTGSCHNDQLLPADATKLAALGISLQLYAIYLILLQSTYVLVTMGVVFLLLWRRSAHGFSLFTALTLVAWILFVVDAPSVLAGQSPFWSVVDGLFTLAGFASFTIFFFLFPSGHFAARWARWLAAGLMVVTVAFFVAAHGSANASIGVYLALFAIWFAAIIGMQVYRYRKVSTPVERQQTKWVVFGLAVSLLGFVFLLATQVFVGATQTGLPNELLAGLYYPFELLIPLSIGIAILRHRLFDIDVIIRRTLLYATLTVNLAAIYFGVVIGAQALIQAFIRQTDTPPVVMVASTLLIAALFNPLRGRIQTAIDRRFYRRKYDTAKTLAAFGATLRSETDLSALSDHLVGVVEETMRPAHASLWLRPSGTREASQTVQRGGAS